jgi:hypothetical protein
VLGAQFTKLRAPLPEFMLFGGMMISRADIPHLRRMSRSPALGLARGQAAAALRPRAAARAARHHAVPRQCAGRALVQVGARPRGRGAHRHLRDGPAETTRAAWWASDLEGRGQRFKVHADRGVVLAAGGISHDAALRPRHVPALAGTLSATVAPGAARSGARTRAGSRCGGFSNEGSARQGFWVPASRFTRADGTPGLFPHTVTDRGKPGLIAVNAQGRRFVNEGLSYHEFVRGQLQSGAVPAWLVCDRRFLWRYGLGCVQPFTRSVERLVANGSLHRAVTLAALAGQLGIDPGGLTATVERFNQHARHGADPEFGRGGDIYQRHLGDADHAPNPCVAPIESAPFYAVEVRPADLGMAAGLVTDAAARVLSPDGTPIAGLYACGNDMQSVMNGAYPGPGITLGPALVFGYIAGRLAAAAALNPRG